MNTDMNTDMNTGYYTTNIPLPDPEEYDIIADAPNYINEGYLQVKTNPKCQTFEKTTRGRSLNQDVLDKIASHVIGIETNSYLQKIQEERDLELQYEGRGR
jgi:hypothetical protein